MTIQFVTKPAGIMPISISQTRKVRREVNTVAIFESFRASRTRFGDEISEVEKLLQTERATTQRQEQLNQAAYLTAFSNLHLR